MTVLADNKVKPSVVGSAELTHGTLESHDLGPSRDLYEKVLRLRCVRHAPVSQLIGGCGDTCVVSVKAGDKLSPQGDENRWVIAAGSEQAVADIHRDAAASDYVKELGDITTKDGVSRFVLQDGDSNWWEVTSLPEDYYQQFFERGDIA